MNKYIICSIPKSGTWLISALLDKAGLKATKWHIEPAGYVDYNFKEAKYTPSKFRIKKDLNDIISELGNDEHVVSHFSPDNIAAIDEEVKTIFVYRNLRDVIVSFARWEKSTRRHEGEYDNNWYEYDDYNMITGFMKLHYFDRRVIKTIQNTTAWANDNPTSSINYEALVGDYGTTAKQSAVYNCLNKLGRPELYKSDLIDVLHNDTVTKSNKRSNWESIWNDEVERMFKSKGLDKLNDQLPFIC